MEKKDEQNPDIKSGDEGEVIEPAKFQAVVEELKQSRQERAFYKEGFEGLTAKIEELEGKLTKAPEGELSEEEKQKKLIREVLNENNASSAKANKQAAIDKFIADNKEFHVDNDPTGLKKQAFLDKLSFFNLDSLDGDKFVSAVKDAYRLAGGSDSTTQSPRDIQNPYSITPTNGTQLPPKKDEEFSDEEKKVMERTGISPERFKTMKEKNPDFIAGLFRR